MENPIIPSERNHTSHEEEEEPIIVLDRSDITVGVERCTRSLIGRLLADRSFSAGTIEAALGSIWRNLNGFKIVDRGGNIFQLFFNEERDVIRIERGVLEADIFSVKGKENSIVKQYDMKELEAFVIIVDILDMRSGGRRENLMKENHNPNSVPTDSSQHTIGRKPIPINLLKDLVGLSVQPKANTIREEKEVTSEHIPNTAILDKPQVLTLAVKDSAILGENIVHEPENSQFLFQGTKSCSHSSSRKPSLKQRARNKFQKVIGVKHNVQDNKEAQIQKHRCSENATTAEEGEGATLEWAPNAQ
ncbi:hypothetical protein PIB30_012900 [Stylosanthes scabra]|uniref:DUF4283 domain-containing protein n=1 Tax=Stylosanthes scabra TaxID=79078 RepID=A0ABU6X6B3_9FABA|nr:hypothetical protein [Stylosanthes scabra]